MGGDEDEKQQFGSKFTVRPAYSHSPLYCSAWAAWSQTNTLCHKLLHRYSRCCSTSSFPGKTGLRGSKIMSDNVTGCGFDRYLASVTVKASIRNDCCFSWMIFSVQNDVFTFICYGYKVLIDFFMS